jgi:hypothetical protein
MNHPNHDDPIVAEVRREREEYAAKFGYDMKLINEDTKRRARVLRELFAPHDLADEEGDDPNDAELGRIREEYAAKFGFDMKLIDEDTQLRARELRARFVPRDEPDDKSDGALEGR